MGGRRSVSRSGNTGGSTGSGHRGRSQHGTARPCARWLAAPRVPPGRRPGSRLAHLPTHQAAAQAQDFLRAVAKAQPQRCQVDRDCGCEQRGAPCRHREVVVPDTNPVSVVVRPRRESTDCWELVVRGGDGSRLRVSDPYPSERDALGARDFVLRVVNGEYPIRFEGWNPWEWQDAPGYVPPSVEDAAVTVRVVSPRFPPRATGGCRPAGSTAMWWSRPARTRPTRQRTVLSTLWGR